MRISLIDKVLPGKFTPIGVGVSMGVDSLATIMYLRGRGYKVIPIHYNHNLRDQNDAMQAKFIQFVNKFGFDPFYTNDVSATQRVELSETECRDNRIQFFKDVCSHGQIRYIATGHHLDDCEESYLLNCIRGNPEHQPIKVISQFTGFTIVHPFLLTEKKQLKAYVEGYSFGELKEFVVQDETNSINKGSRRNWIRNVIVPELTSQQISLKKHCRRKIEEQLKDL